MTKTYVLAPVRPTTTNCRVVSQGCNMTRSSTDPWSTVSVCNGGSDGSLSTHLKGMGRPSEGVGPSVPWTETQNRDGDLSTYRNPFRCKRIRSRWSKSLFRSL